MDLYLMVIGKDGCNSFEYSFYSTNPFVLQDHGFTKTVGKRGGKVVTLLWTYL